MDGKSRRTLRKTSRIVQNLNPAFWFLHVGKFSPENGEIGKSHLKRQGTGKFKSRKFSPFLQWLLQLSPGYPPYSSPSKVIFFPQSPNGENSQKLDIHHQSFPSVLGIIPGMSFADHKVIPSYPQWGLVGDLSFPHRVFHIHPQSCGLYHFFFCFSSQKSSIIWI